ncbi:hypothetical protein Golax_017174, partial [Gossypium laxum]|nr:hypothetical protein [Gossypium laxum]
MEDHKFKEIGNEGGEEEEDEAPKQDFQRDEAAFQPQYSTPKGPIIRSPTRHASSMGGSSHQGMDWEKENDQWKRGTQLILMRTSHEEAQQFQTFEDQRRKHPPIAYETTTINWLMMSLMKIAVEMKNAKGLR